MKTLIPLDPYTIPLQSINLIEASAGTGKSWTVTLLYLRLILESALNVDQILVVTFTDAATKELRDAVRNRLVEALRYFENPESDAEPEYKALYEKNAKDEANLKTAIHRLKRAKLSIDESAIFTIHSFCQRALKEYAFEAALPFESELMDDDKDLMQKLTDDFWRRKFNKAPKTLLFKLKYQNITPESLLKDVWKHVGKPYLKNKGPVSEDIKEQEWQQLESLFETAKNTWIKNAEAITQLLIGHGGLNKGTYSEVKILNFCQIMCECGSHSFSQYQESGARLDQLGETTLSKKLNKGAEIPIHSFFKQWQAFLDYWDDIKVRSDDFIHRIRIDLLAYLRAELPKEKKRLGLLAYDDLLLQLQTALQTKPELAAYLREKYQAALLDEFQDTDPTQYDIFRRIYIDKDSENSSDNTVFFVGDPKQAIYSFRGGDIYTYLKAKQQTPINNQYTLNVNYRSHAKLIEAYNALYAQADNPFQDPSIQYQPISAGKEFTEVTIKNQNDSHRKPLQFWQFVPEKDDNADSIKNQIARAVAGDIATLLNSKILINDEKDKDKNKVVSGGDFAILVRSHSQGDIMKSALNERGIASIQSSPKSIFETREADEMLALMGAIIEPQKDSGVRRALVTELMGKTAKDLLAFESDTNLWETQLDHFQQWHFQWKQQGFLPMIRNLMQESKLHQHLLSFTDGERRLTNLLHLSELIHRVTRQQSLSMEEVLRWLKKQQENAHSSNTSKEGELRLESDENLVKIVTIHKSKGLEYPIVYCPFIGLTGDFPADKTYSFYEEGQPFLEIGSPQAEQHKALKEAEEAAEQSRLLYVALTRAKYQCHVVCFPEAIKGNPDKTALGWLLSNGKRIIPKASKIADKEKNKEFYSSYAKNLQALVSQSDVIGLDDLPEYDASLHYHDNEVAQILKAREFTTTLKSQAQVTSFSGLTASAHADFETGFEKGFEGGFNDAEAPDHDEQQSDPIQSIQAELIIENEFPRGATAGSALHEIYEHLDFEVAINEQQDIIENSLNKWGFDKKHIGAANNLMENSLQAQIFEGFALNQLSKTQRLDEMEFYLPLEQLNINKLQQLLYQHLPDDWTRIREAVKSLNFEEVEGFLKGYIDLIFEHQGRYYIVDYKSNSLADYAPKSLMPVMADSHYYLQYLFYSVALHRYLQKRIADYSWETHSGGAYYLFIRGMKQMTDLHKTDSRANARQSWSEATTTRRANKMSKKGGGVHLENPTGVFYDKPSLGLITALDGLFMESFL